MDATMNDVARRAETGPCIDFLFAYTDHDIPKMLSFCAPEGEVYFKPLGEGGRGKISELGESIWLALIDSFPDLKNFLHASVELGDRIRCEVLIEGTQNKDFAGIKSVGGAFSSGHIFVFRLNAAKKIDYLEIDWNHEDFARQLSLTKGI